MKCFVLQIRTTKFNFIPSSIHWFIHSLSDVQKIDNMQMFVHCGPTGSGRGLLKENKIKPRSGLSQIQPAVVVKYTVYSRFPSRLQQNPVFQPDVVQLRNRSLDIAAAAAAASSAAAAIIHAALETNGSKRPFRSCRVMILFHPGRRSCCPDCLTRVGGSRGWGSVGVQRTCLCHWSWPSDKTARRQAVNLRRRGH